MVGVQTAFYVLANVMLPGQVLRLDKAACKARALDLLAALPPGVARRTHALRMKLLELSCIGILHTGNGRLGFSLEFRNIGIPAIELFLELLYVGVSGDHEDPSVPAL